MLTKFQVFMLTFYHIKMALGGRLRASGNVVKHWPRDPKLTFGPKYITTYIRAKIKNGLWKFKFENPTNFSANGMWDNHKIHLDEQVIMTRQNPMLTQFCIHHSWESCFHFTLQISEEFHFECGRFWIIAIYQLCAKLFYSVWHKIVMGESFY